MVKLHENISLLPYNTFGMDVRAALLAEYETLDDLRQLLHTPKVKQLMDLQREAGQLPFWHIGSGSNLLFKTDYPGVVLHCTAKGIRVAEPTASTADNYLLEVEAGTIWDDVCAYCADNGLYGPENLSLIPGEAGAAAVQNIGAYGVEIKDLIYEVITFDVETERIRSFSPEEMHYGYRESLLKLPEAKARYIVTRLVLRVSKEPRLNLGYAGLSAAITVANPTAADVREAVIRIREGKLPDPKVLGNAGSFFKNPVVTNDVYEALLAQYPSMPHYKVDEQHTKIPAGWLIEQCGWKGKSLGNAGVYEKQSLVLVNRGGARPDEVVTLCQTIITDVAKKFGITIHPEVNII